MRQIFQNYSWYTWYRASWQVRCLWAITKDEKTWAVEKKSSTISFNIFKALERKSFCSFHGWKPAFVHLSSMAQVQVASFWAWDADPREGTRLQFMRFRNRKAEAVLPWMGHVPWKVHVLPSLLVVWILSVSLWFASCCTERGQEGFWARMGAGY